jgi:NIPSNAP
MNLRIIVQNFFTLAALAGAVSLVGISSTALAADSSPSQYYELRVYTTKSEQQQKLISDYWQNAAVPAYNRMGIQPVGVFTELEDSPTNKIYVLVPCDSLEVFAAIPGHLAADATYQAAAASYLARPKSEPAFGRIESSLNVAFDSMKKLAVPQSSADKTPWIFELRTYESPSEAKGINKVEMFNSGEVPLMQEVGLSPVFFSQTIVGSQMPNLVYMVSGENMDEHKKHWKGFGDSPVWKKLSGDPQYKDNVSKVISIFLKRTTASQI